MTGLPLRMARRCQSQPTNVLSQDWCRFWRFKKNCSPPRAQRTLRKAFVFLASSAARVPKAAATTGLEGRRAVGRRP